VRGGAFLYNGWYARCAYRYSYDPHDWDYYTGFRVVVLFSGSRPISPRSGLRKDEG